MCYNSGLDIIGEKNSELKGRFGEIIQKVVVLRQRKRWKI